MDNQEKQWLDQYRGGDIQALGKLVEAYRRPLFGFIHRMTENSADAEEIFQEVWLKAVKNMDRFKDGSLLSWLFRITHNLIIDRARKKKPDCSLDDPRGDHLTLADLTESPLRGPASQTADMDLGTKIRGAVQRLPEDQKEVFLLRTEGGVPFKEIAKIQKISINTALARMQYAMARLRQELASEYSEIVREVS